jgi:L-ribulokinase
MGKSAKKAAKKASTKVARAPVLGLDFGTSGVRALVVDALSGEALGSVEKPYQHGVNGVITSKSDPHLARQDPQDYGDAMRAAIRSALNQARIKHKMDPESIRGVGTSATGSTPIPFTQGRIALGLEQKFRKEPDAMAWLWKDHTAHAEAQEITDLATKQGRPYLSKCGGVYSSEWYWSKILRCCRVNPRVAARLATWVELSDWTPYLLAGAPEGPLARNLCAAGHKAMYHESWGGLPAAEFLDALHPGLSRFRDDYATPVAPGTLVGTVPAHTAKVNRLPRGAAVAVGAIDAHLGAVGSGCAPGTLVKIIGTSTCDCVAVPLSQELPDIPGVCGIVPESILPGHHGIEAGQSGVGDIFNWFVSGVLGRSGEAAGRAHAELTAAAAAVAPGASGLLTLDWHNGNRNVLTDPRLTGLTVGQTLATTPAELYRSLIEATAFGARMIIERICEFGVAIDRVVCCGGIAEKNPLLMQIYADVLGRPMHIAGSDQACALGAAVMASVAAGVHRDVITAQKAMTSLKAVVYRPHAAASAVYERLFVLYRQMHDAFGTSLAVRPMNAVMKDLLKIQQSVRA